jgi:hypothetical protein
MLISVTCTSTSIALDLQAFVNENNAVLIAWRIYRTRRFIPEGLAAFLPVFIVVVESGALYATSVFALLIATLVGSNAQYIMLAIISPIVVSLVALD